MEQFLDNLGLSHLLADFTKHNITMDLLFELTQEHLQQLVPNIGDQIQFKRGVRQLQIEQATVEFGDDFASPLTKKPRASSSPLPVSEKSPTATSHEISDLIEDNTKLNDSVLDIIASNAPKADSNSNYSLQSTITDLQNSSCGLNSSFLSYCPTQAVTNFDLKQILSEDILGRAIVTKYGSKLTLDTKDRNIICEIIITYFLNRSYKLNNESLSIIASKIVNLFPACEKRTTYFVSPVPKRRSGRNRPEIAKGKLVDKHRNKLTAIRRALQFQVTEGQKSADLTEEPSQTAKDSRIWLSINNEPTDEVLQHWRNSYPIRKITVNKNKTIEQFYQEWPILETQLAIELVTYDFMETFKKENDIEEAFQHFFEKVLVIRRKKLSAADETILNLLDGNITTDSRRAIQLYLLPSLIPPRGRTKTRGKQWKPSITECRDGIFLHVKSPGD